MGKVFWTDGKVTLAEKEEQTTNEVNTVETSDLPF